MVPYLEAQPQHLLTTPNSRMIEMTTRNIGFAQLTIAASAVLITFVSSWAFVTSSASVERDPFHFAAVMAANAKASTMQYEVHNVLPTVDPRETEG